MVFACFNKYSPLEINRNKVRNLTVNEQQDFERMKRAGPKIDNGDMPTEEDPHVHRIRKTTYKNVPVTWITFRDAANRSRIEGYVMGFKFQGRPATKRFIDNFVAANNTDRIRNIAFNMNSKANTRTQRAFKAAKLQALNATYDAIARRGNGTTIAMFRRRGLIQKIEV